MPTSTLTSKGQTTVPKEVREALDLDEGDKLTWEIGDGEIKAFVTQFAIFEVTYVLQSYYGMPTSRVAALMRDLIALPGVTAIDDCPWRKVFDLWPEQLGGLADASSVAVAIANHYDAIATFDQKMIKRMRSIGVESYW